MTPVARLTALVIAASVPPLFLSAQEAGQSPEQIVSEWMSSAHADSSAEAFRHWDDEAEIPGNCAVCHSTPGFVAYLATDLTTPPVIAQSVPVGTVIDCTSCHDPGLADLTAAVFPSGASFGFDDGSTVCTVCHQGRTAGSDVSQAAEGLDPDTVSPELGFINIHYAAAATTLLGSEVGGGFEYPDLGYAGRFAHVPEFDTCLGCHAPHSTEVVLDDCTTCHAGAASFDAIRIRPEDVDGDGDTAEGIVETIAGLQDRLGQAITRYADEIAAAPILYVADAYPYFFNDSNADGSADPEEASYPNRYQSWTPRLLRAAYNYQAVSKDPGGFAHNPDYLLQLLIDSLADLSQAVEVDLAGLARP